MPLWPLIVILWHRRSVNSVQGLEVHFLDAGPEALEFGSKKHRAITIQFTNHTGCVAYISGERVRSITKNFPVPVEAARDVGRDSYHLKFSASPAEVAMRGVVAANSGVAVPLATREVTLQTNDSRQTAMPGDPPPEFFKHSPSRLRRIYRVERVATRTWRFFLAWSYWRCFVRDCYRKFGRTCDSRFNLPALRASHNPIRNRHEPHHCRISSLRTG